MIGFFGRFHGSLCEVVWREVNPYVVSLVKAPQNALQELVLVV